MSRYDYQNSSTLEMQDHMNTQTTVTLWTIQDVANHLNMTIGSTRHWLSRHHIHATTKAPGNRALYNVEQIGSARAEQARKTEARNRLTSWGRWT